MKTNNRSHCPINYALETFGDAWSLLIVRDIVFWGKKTYGEFLTSQEKIASNILSARLNHLIEQGVLTKETDQQDQRKIIYRLTDKGLDLIPMLLEMSGWASLYDPETIAPENFINYIFHHRKQMFELIRRTIKNGGSLFAGTDCVMSQWKLKVGENERAKGIEPSSPVWKTGALAAELRPQRTRL